MAKHTPANPDAAHSGAPLYPATTAKPKESPLPNQPFQQLPKPTGQPPYRLDLAQVLRPDDYAKIAAAGKMVFHVIGDTGGVKSPEPQQIVAMHMEDDFANPVAPSFCYHVGDVVYYNGAYSEYYPQFYDPYGQYPAPILAIPGNHDGDPLDHAVEPSLAAFVANFCAAQPHLTPEAQEVQRDAITQPNVYWTLLTPYLTIVGLYTNVPEGGRVEADQLAWFEQELRDAPADKALIVAMHHPAYSLDTIHGGSEHMGDVLDKAIAAAGRSPELVLTGHVHNYQRFTRNKDGDQITYLVNGAGGYWNLHYLAKDNGKPITVPYQLAADVTLQQYVEDRHGFLGITADDTQLLCEYTSVPRPQESWRNGPVTVADSFTIPTRKP